MEFVDKRHKRQLSSSEDEVAVSQKNFRKKISSKGSGKDFFDFNDGFTKVKPLLTTALDKSSTVEEQEIIVDSLVKENDTKSQESEDDGSLTPPPAIFQDTEELKNVFTRLKSLKSFDNSLKITKKSLDSVDLVNISVLIKTWPESCESRVSSSFKSDESDKSDKSDKSDYCVKSC